jgi:membrane protein required for colicin V production
MSALDIFVLLLLGGGALIGFVRGFVQEVLSLLAWVVAVAMLKLFHEQLWSGITGFVGSSAGAAVLAFALLFVPTFVIVKLLARILGRRSRKSVLGPFDQMLGGGFGMLKGLIGATLFFLFANLTTDMIYGADAERPGWMRDSRTYPLLNASGRAIVDWVDARRKPKIER